MTANIISFPGISIVVSDGWQDITTTLSEAGQPFTIADPKNGVGVLQFTPAIFKSGKVPHVAPNDLDDLLNNFAVAKGLGDEVSTCTIAGATFGVGKSFHSADDVVRVWYLSNGHSIVLATYICDWDSRHVEEAQTDEMIRSIRLN